MPDISPRLKAHVAWHVHAMLREAYQPYLRSLSRQALLDELCSELTCLGLYRRDDTATAQQIRAILEATLPAVVWLELTPWVQRYTTATQGIPILEEGP